MWIFFLFALISCYNCDSFYLTNWEMSSSADYNSNWYPITVPATVMAGSIQNKIYPNIFFGTNMQNISQSLFDVPWWFRNSFSIKVYRGLLFNSIRIMNLICRTRIRVRKRCSVSMGSNTKPQFG